jgi:hypothetical protein
MESFSRLGGPSGDRKRECHPASVGDSFIVVEGELRLITHAPKKRRLFPAGAKIQSAVAASRVAVADVYDDALGAGILDADHDQSALHRGFRLGIRLRRETWMSIGRSDAHVFAVPRVLGVRRQDDHHRIKGNRGMASGWHGELLGWTLRNEHKDDGGLSSQLHGATFMSAASVWPTDIVRVLS